MTISINGYDCANAFEEAIALAGGPTALGKLVGLTYQRIAQIRDVDHGEVKKTPLARAIESAVGVPATELSHYGPWRGPDRHPPKGRRPDVSPGVTEANGTAPEAPEKARVSNVVSLSAMARQGRRVHTRSRYTPRRHLAAA